MKTFSEYIGSRNTETLMLRCADMLIERCEDPMAFLYDHIERRHPEVVPLLMEQDAGQSDINSFFSKANQQSLWTRAGNWLNNLLGRNQGVDVHLDTAIGSLVGIQHTLEGAKGAAGHVPGFEDFLKGLQTSLEALNQIKPVAKQVAQAVAMASQSPDLMKSMQPQPAQAQPAQPAQPSGYDTAKANIPVPGHLEHVRR